MHIQEESVPMRWQGNPSSVSERFLSVVYMLLSNLNFYMGYDYVCICVAESRPDVEMRGIHQ